MAAASPEPSAIEEAVEQAKKAGFGSALKALLEVTWLRLRTGEFGALPVLVALAAIWGYFQYKESVFLSARNLSNLILQIGVTGTLAVGIVLVLLLGGVVWAVTAGSTERVPKLVRKDPRGRRTAQRQVIGRDPHDSPCEHV